MSIAPTGHNETFDRRAFSDDETTVRRKCRPAFANKVFLGSFHLRHEARKTLLERVQDIPVRIHRRWAALQRVSPRIGIQCRRFPASNQKATLAYAAVKRLFR